MASKKSKSARIKRRKPRSTRKLRPITRRPKSKRSQRKSVQRLKPIPRSSKRSKRNNSPVSDDASSLSSSDSEGWPVTYLPFPTHRMIPSLTLSPIPPSRVDHRVNQPSRSANPAPQMFGYRWEDLNRLYREYYNQAMHLSTYLQLVIEGQEIVVDGIPVLRGEGVEPTRKIRGHDLDSTVTHVVTVIEYLDYWLTKIGTKNPTDLIPLDLYEIINQGNDLIHPVIRLTAVFQKEIEMIDELVKRGLRESKP